MQKLPKLPQLPLYARVLIGVALGTTLGAIFGKQKYLFGFGNDDFGAISMLVIKALKALAVPLVFFAILDAFLKTEIKAKQFGKLAIICLVNVSVAMIIALTIANIFQAGKTWQPQMAQITKAIGEQKMPTGKNEDPEAPPPTLEVIPNVSYYVPSSLAKPFVYNTLISVVLLAIFIGAAIRKVRQNSEGHENTASLENIIHALYQVLVQMLEWVVLAIPFAVFGILAKVVGAAGLGVFSTLWVFLAVALAGLFLHAGVYYPLVAWLVGKKSPKVYLGHGLDAITTGLSTNSSLATVPITLRCLSKMGVTPESSRLAACVGTNLNNDGITLYEATAALFLAQALGMSVGLGGQLTIILAAIMAGAGIAGIPEAGLIVLPLVLSAAGIPEAMIAIVFPLLLPVDWIIARVRSGVNVMSDMLVAILLDVGEKRKPEE
jgi:Na+/H+-dicarboxylate symporter